MDKIHITIDQAVDLQEFPSLSRQEYIRALRADTEWIIGTSDASQADIVRSAGMDINAKCQVDNGWIVGCNMGEFGGELLWTSPTFSERYVISKRSVKFLFQMPVGIVGLSGIYHMNLSEGSIFDVRSNSRQRWIDSDLYNLGASPQAALRDSADTILIATTSSLLRFSTKCTVETIVDNLGWGGLYPNSIAIFDGNIYIGMRCLIAKVSKRESMYTLGWLKPNRDTLRSA